VTSQPSDENTDPAPATPPFFLTEPVSDLAITYFYGHLFVADPEIGSMFPAAMDAQRHRFYRALRQLELDYPRLEVHPATSEEQAEGIARGTIPILGAKADWDDTDVYISGPDAMIVKTAGALRTLGADPAQLHYDLPDEDLPDEN
jgi:hypothetical protein